MGGTGSMKAFDFHLLRHTEAQLRVLAQILGQGRDIHDATDRAALALNVRAQLAPDVLVFTLVQAPRQEQIRPGDLLVGVASPPVSSPWATSGTPPPPIESSCCTEPLAVPRAGQRPTTRGAP